MIRSFKHTGLAKFFETGTKSCIQAQHAERLRLILGRLSAATAPRDMALPGLDLHQLKGDRKGDWAVSVSGSWRATFRFIEKDAEVVDYEDYH
ncbi:MAG: peptidase [Nitrospira sp.]|nr:peptidase [Nitrospira sp.]